MIYGRHYLHELQIKGEPEEDDAENTDYTSDEDEENTASNTPDEETGNEEPLSLDPNDDEDSGEDTDYTADDDSEPVEDQPDDTTGDDQGTEDTSGEDMDLDPDTGDNSGDDSSDYTSDDSVSTDDDSDETQDQLDDINAEIKKTEDEIFSSLTPEEKNIKIQKLMKDYSNLYDLIVNCIEQLNGANKTTASAPVIEFIVKTLFELKTTVNDIINKNFATRTYIENMAVFKQNINILSQIQKLISELPKLDNPDD